MAKEVKTYQAVRAVKNRLCRIEDNLNKVFLLTKDKDLMVTVSDIDDCVLSLEKLMDKLKTN